MKKKRVFGKVIKIFTAIIASVLALAIGAVLVLRFAVLPKISQKLQSSGRDDLAAIVEQNNNLSSFALFGRLLTDRGVLKFVASLDSGGSSSVVNFMETITEENPPEDSSSDEPTAADTPWKVDEVRHIPRSTPVPSPTPAPTPSPTTAPSSHSASTAYERIAAVATEQDMSDGLAIIAKLDMGYVASLVADGLTPAEKSELKSYVYSKLTKAEVSRAIALYNKYKKYL